MQMHRLLLPVSKNGSFQSGGSRFILKLSTPLFCCNEV